jgi:serine/threonine protein phosphatase 1
MAGPIYFAIGDVHGEADKLRRLHASILERIAVEGRAARIVHLGDYVDRGPDSRGVIEMVMALETRFDRDPAIEVISLMGNHEQMMLDAYDAARSEDAGSWWAQGGEQTADSYAGGPGQGNADWRVAVPAEHIAWMRGLGGLYYDKERRLAFVHAGIDPARFPEEDANTYLWTRSLRFFEQQQWPPREELKELTVVHGHTPRSVMPEVFPHRINVDTGAVFGGPLTAVMLKEGERPAFLRAT